MQEVVEKKGELVRKRGQKRRGLKGLEEDRYRIEWLKTLIKEHNAELSGKMELFRAKEEKVEEIKEVKEGVRKKINLDGIEELREAEKRRDWLKVSLSWNSYIKWFYLDLELDFGAKMYKCEF
jgi:hypothetical protein